MSVDDEIQKILDEIDKTPSNKATQGHLGKLKAKLARLREEKDLRKRKKSGVSTASYSVKKTGDATVALVGFPSVGKSTLINRITNAESKVAAYEFTTLKIVPGVLEYNGAKIQILDVPGIIEDASVGRGFGKKVLSVVRSADLILIVVDVLKKPKEQISILKKELYNIGVRMNKKKPDVAVERRSYGGIIIRKTVKLKNISDEMIKGIMQEFGLHNAEIVIKSDITADDLIDALSSNRIYLPMLIVANKIDGIKDIEALKKEVNEECVYISADKELNLEELKKKIFENLNIMRIYLKQPGKPADMKEPLIMRKASTVIEVCKEIHKDLAKNFLAARIWGKSAKFEGQQVGAEHILIDQDVVEMNMRK